MSDAACVCTVLRSCTARPMLPDPVTEPARLLSANGDPFHWIVSVRSTRKGRALREERRREESQTAWLLGWWWLERASTSARRREADVENADRGDGPARRRIISPRACLRVFFSAVEIGSATGAQRSVALSPFGEGEATQAGARRGVTTSDGTSQGVIARALRATKRSFVGPLPRRRGSRAQARGDRRRLGSPSTYRRKAPRIAPSPRRFTAARMTTISALGR